MKLKDSSWGLLAVGAFCAILAVGFGGWPRARSQADGTPESGATPLLATSALGASSAILFLVDPDNRTLSAYEAIPGGEGGLRWLGARKIDHDLKLTKYRDLSEFSYSELRERYDARSAEEDQER